MMFATACERPDITTPERSTFGALSEGGVGFTLLDATFRVDGVVRSDRINLATDRFSFLYVFIQSKGMFIVTAEEAEGAAIAGGFIGPRVTFLVGGTRVEFESEDGHVLGDQHDRSAWVEYRPDYKLLGPDAKPGDAVVGLARQKNLIPGFDGQAP